MQGDQTSYYRGHRIVVSPRRIPDSRHLRYSWVAYWQGHAKHRGGGATSKAQAVDDAEYAIAHNAPDNPVDIVDNAVGHFVSEHPWISALIGTAALGAAGWTGAYLMSLAIGKKTTTSTTSLDTTAAPTSTTTSPSTSTSTTTSAPSTSSNSATSSSSSSSSAPTYSSASAIPLYLQSAGKKVTVGSSLVLSDANTGLVVTDAQVSGQAGVLAAGPTGGTFLAVAPGTVKLYDPVTGNGTIVEVVSGTAGVAAAPMVRRLPKIRGLSSLVLGA